MNVEEILSSVNQQAKNGYTYTEVLAIRSKIPESSLKTFDSALTGISAASHNGEILYYEHDVRLAITCALENRKMRPYEFD